MIVESRQYTLGFYGGGEWEIGNAKSVRDADFLSFDRRFLLSNSQVRSKPARYDSCRNKLRTRAATISMATSLKPPSGMITLA